MQELIDTAERPTLASLVFEHLYDEINSLKLLPGTKLSEAEVARRFDVSPQPVRDAFYRLSSMNLLLVKPQRASKVRGFSLSRIEDARFIRLAIELEVCRRACEIWDESKAATLQKNLDLQQRSVNEVEPDEMHSLDYEFHRLICELGGCPRAFATIKLEKQKMDRLCVLEHDHRVKGLESIFRDHQRIAEALRTKSVNGVLDAARHHLAGLDKTIKFVYETHSEYFEPE